MIQIIDKKCRNMENNHDFTLHARNLVNVFIIVFLGLHPSGAASTQWVNPNFLFQCIFKSFLKLKGQIETGGR